MGDSLPAIAIIACCIVFAIILPVTGVFTDMDDVFHQRI